MNDTEWCTSCATREKEKTRALERHNQDFGTCKRPSEETSRSSCCWKKNLLLWFYYHLTEASRQLIFSVLANVCRREFSIPKIPFISPFPCVFHVNHSEKPSGPWALGEKATKLSRLWITLLVGLWFHLGFELVDHVIELRAEQTWRRRRLSSSQSRSHKVNGKKSRRWPWSESFSAFLRFLIRNSRW